MVVEKFGERLREAIDLKGLTVYQVAKEIGLNKKSIADYIDGNSVPGIDKVIKISDYLGVSVGWLAAGEGEIEKSQAKKTQIVPSNRVEHGYKEKYYNLLERHNSLLEKYCSLLEDSKTRSQDPPEEDYVVPSPLARLKGGAYEEEEELALAA